jgi:hypothetical protein
MKKLFLVLFLICLALSYIGYGWFLKTQQPRQLLIYFSLEDALLPTQISFVRDGEQVFDIVNWMYDPSPGPLSKRLFADTVFAPVDYDQIWLASWRDGLGSRYLRVSVIDYHYPILAWIGFELNKPSIRGRGSWNFVYSPSDITPASWTEYSSGDQSLVQCANGTEELCGEWYYQARYGQYYVLVELPGAANADSFNQIVKGIIHEFEAHLN